MRGPRDPFELPGDGSGHRGALVVHGFTGSPFEMRWIGERLAARGFEVIGPALAGHEHGSPEELDRTTWHDWYASAELAFDELRSRCERVAVVGLSMGGLLALHLAHERQAQVTALAAMATPIWLPRPIEAAIRVVNGTLRAGERLPFVGGMLAGGDVPPLPKLGGQSDLADPGARAENPTMPAMPVRALATLLELQQQVRRDLPGVRQPAFLAHARLDHTAPFACLEGIRSRIGTPPGELQTLELEHSYHVITIDLERALLARRVGEFLEEKLP